MSMCDPIGKSKIQRSAGLGKPAVAIALVLLFFCGFARAESISIRDNLDRQVTVQVPVNRAVIFQLYEIIPALGIWDRVVGIGRHAYRNDLIIASKPDVAKAIPSPGTGTDINIEALFALKPELVITWIYRPDSVRFLEDRGIKVLGVSPENLSEFYEAVRLLGRVFKKEEKAEACLTEMDRLFSFVKQRVSRVQPGAGRKVLWLLGKPTTVACELAVSNDLITRMGGINPAARIQRASLDISMEQIVAWNPDVIFIWGYAGYTAESLFDNSQWRSVAAVKQRKVYKAPLWSIWSPRIAPIVLWMAMKTYPERFTDVDGDKMLDEFYRKVFGIPHEKVNGFD